MELGKESDDRRYKRSIQVVFVIFVGLLLFFTLFSNTLQSLTLPKVRTERIASGSLLFTLEGNGMLQPLVEAELTNSAGWRVQQILVKEGEYVKQGQPLILYDSKSTERELEDEIAYLDKQKLDMQNLQDQFIWSTNEGDEFKIRSARRAIETLKLDLGMQERKIGELTDLLAIEQKLTAPFDGIITKLNATLGFASTGEPNVLISNNSLGYRLDLTADSTLLSSLGISIGEKVEVQVQNVQEQQARIIDGILAGISNVQQRTESSSEDGVGWISRIPQQMIRIKIVDSELKGDEQARIKLEKRSRLEGLVVSNEAIHQDHDGLFVYKVDEQRGALGNVFVTRKVRIKFSETNEKETMIQADSLYADDLIIMESSEPLQDGDRVRLQ